MGSAGASGGVTARGGGQASTSAPRTPSRRWVVLDHGSTSGLASEVAHAIDAGGISGVIVAVHALAQPSADLVAASAYCRAREVPIVLALDTRDVPISSEGATDDVTCRHDSRFAMVLAARMTPLVSTVLPTALLGREWAPQPWPHNCAGCLEEFERRRGQGAAALDDPDGLAHLEWRSWEITRVTTLWEAFDEAISGILPGSTRWTGLVPGDLHSQLARAVDLGASAASAPMVFVDARRFDGVRRVERARASFGRIVDSVGVPVIAVQPGAFAGSALDCSTRVTEPLELLTSAMLASMQGAEIAATPAGWESVTSGMDARDLRFGDAGTRCAEVAIAWSCANQLAYGRAWSALLADMPYHGIASALDALHVPYRAVEVGTFHRGLAGVKLLVLPDLAVLSERAEAEIRAFVDGGGALLATGATGLADDVGEPRSCGRLDDVLGVHRASVHRLDAITAQVDHGFVADPPLGRLYGPATEHSYIRLLPELARQTPGPHVDREPRVATSDRHPILDGFGSTDLLAYGGRIRPMEVQPDRAVLATLVPAFPSMPIEEVYPRPERTDIPAIVVGEFGSGRVAYLPADIDRRYGADPLPDHLALLGNIVNWLIGSTDTAVSCTNGSVLSSWWDTSDGLRLHLLNITGLGQSGGQRRSLPPARHITVRARKAEFSVDHLDRYLVRSVTPERTERHR